MVYDPNTPESADESPAVSQPKITANFQSLQNFLKFNHTDIAASDEGKHNFLTMPKQDAAPTPAGGEMALYVKQPDSSANKLFLFLKDQDGTEKEVLPKETAQTNGKLVMPGGLIFLWGSKRVKRSHSTSPDPKTANVFHVDFHSSGFNQAFVVNFSIGDYQNGYVPFLLHHLDPKYFEVDAPSQINAIATLYYLAIGI